MTGWQMYWLLRLDNIRDVFEGVAGVGLTFGLLGLLGCVTCRAMYAADGVGNALKVMNCLRKPVFVLLVVGGIGLLGIMSLPSSKQMAAIIVVPKIVNNKQVQEIPENLLELCNEWTKDKIKELKGVTK